MFTLFTNTLSKTVGLSWTLASCPKPSQCLNHLELLRTSRDHFQATPPVAWNRFQSLPRRETDQIRSNRFGFFPTVIPIYSKGGGKAGRHDWVEQVPGIGKISYILAQTFEHSGGCSFRRIHRVTSMLGVSRFVHLPSDHPAGSHNPVQ
ncbi:hypothetical protein B0H11DRAFT_1955287 [Mycena galericulata]|nr:hypothetical protein B0H11DRAFT_1955287 [Mycena galericulata]